MYRGQCSPYPVRGGLRGSWCLLSLVGSLRDDHGIYVAKNHVGDKGCELSSMAAFLKTTPRKPTASCSAPRHERRVGSKACVVAACCVSRPGGGKPRPKYLWGVDSRSTSARRKIDRLICDSAENYRELSRVRSLMKTASLPARSPAGWRALSCVG